MHSDADSIPTWVRWLLIAAGVALIGLLVLGVVVFIYPWVIAFG